jgi:catechol-2,3-dioxygenase
VPIDSAGSPIQRAAGLNRGSHGGKDRTSEPRGPAIGSLRAVALDAPDVELLATFYEKFTGWQRAPDNDDDWITLDSGDGWQIGLQRATDHVPPHWPDQDRPQQAHLDFRVPDIDTATECAQQLGAHVLRRNDGWHTLADPAGHPFDVCGNSQDARITLTGIMFDCPDAEALSHFYAELLGKPVTYEADGNVMIGEHGAQPVMFQQVENYTAPRWPDPAYPQQIHLDVTVDEIDAAERAALDIGATRLDGAGSDWRVYADPVGKPFCLVWTV